VVSENLKRSFPAKSDPELNILRRKFYRHFCDLLAEGIKNLSISERELKKRFVVKNPALLDELFSQKKSVILVSGHFKNWEWLITSQNFQFKHQAMGIGMPMTSKFWDKKINEKRERFGMKVIHSKNFKEEIEKIQQELKQLTQKHLEIEKDHLQRVKSYKEKVQAFEQKVKDYEQQKSLHQRLFGQPPLQPDPELLIDPELLPDPELQSVKDEIARLEKDKDNYFKILQVLQRKHI
jgi:hypothetical protein